MTELYSDAGKTLEIHAAAAEGARRKHPNICAACKTPIRDTEEGRRRTPSLPEIADKLRHRDAQLRGADVLDWRNLTRVDQQRWIAMATAAVRAIEPRP